MPSQKKKKFFFLSFSPPLKCGLHKLGDLGNTYTHTGLTATSYLAFSENALRADMHLVECTTIISTGVGAHSGWIKEMSTKLLMSVTVPVHVPLAPGNIKIDQLHILK